jgi:hypothetical protein
MHVSSSQDRRRAYLPTGFNGALRSFGGLSVGIVGWIVGLAVVWWTREEINNMEFKKMLQFKTCISFVKMRPDMLSRCPSQKELL